MRWIASSVVAVFTAATFALPATAQILTATPAYPPSGPASLSATGSRSPEADRVRGWYRDYLGREAGPELSGWAELLRGGMSPTDLQATILGSDEFYYQKGRDPQTFIRETLQAVTWSDPTYNEVQRWVDRLNQLRGDRFALAREILLSSSQSSATPASQLSDIVARLSSAGRLMIDTIDFEIGGTPQGRQANLQAQSLVGAIEQLRRSATSIRPGDAVPALDNADRAYQALQSTLSNPPGTAPSAAGIVRRVGTMLADARLAIRPTTPGYPTNPGPIGSGSNAQQILDQVGAARRATDSLIQMLTSQAYQNYSYSVVLRDLDTLASRLASFEQLVRSGTTRDRLAWELQSLRDISDRVKPQLQAGRLPYFARMYWLSVESSLDQLRDTLGAGSGSGPATVLRPTQFHENLVPLLDQAVSQLDVFLAGINPLVFGIPDVPSVQRDVRNIRNLVLTLRQQTGAGEPASVLKQTLSAMVGDYQDAYDRWNRIVTSYRLVNPAKLSPIGETLNRVEQMINDALSSGDLTPGGPTRMSQDLASLNYEITEARRSLSSVAAYREAQAIDSYLEQLAGYVQQISDSLARQTSLDARRLAVAMQGVVGRLQAEIDALNQRLAGGTREQRQWAGDLQLRTDRIGRLVDVIETSLY